MIQFVYVLFQALIGLIFLHYLYQLFFRLEEHMPTDKCFVALRLEENCGSKKWVRNMIVNQFFMCNNFFEYAFVIVISAVRAVHDEVPLALWLYIHFGNGAGKTGRAPPHFDVLGVCPYFPYEFYGCVQ